ncbi:hypothetical protein [uncultured Helicobacter sp.]
MLLLSLVGSQISLRLRFATFALSFFESQDYLDSVMSLVALDSINPL